MIAPFQSPVVLPFPRQSINWISKACHSYHSPLLPSCISETDHASPHLVLISIQKQVEMRDSRRVGRWVSLQLILTGLIKVDVGCLLFSSWTVSNRINLKAADASCHSFSKWGTEGHGAGWWKATCQPVLLHASPPISLSMSVQNRQVTNKLVSLASFCIYFLCKKSLNLMLRSWQLRIRDGGEGKHRHKL